MNFTELNRSQLEQLAQDYLQETQETVSWGELINALELVPYDELEKAYGHIEFVPEDFPCDVVPF